MEQIGAELKKILMAGIGAVSTGVEKSQQVIDKLAQKGEITFEQAKTLSQECAEKVKKAYDDSSIADFFSCKVKKEHVVEDLKQLGMEELTWLRDQLSGMITAKEQEAQAAKEQEAQPQEPKQAAASQPQAADLNNPENEKQTPAE